MRWIAGSVVVALVAVAAVTVLLLAYGGDRNDPVGKLSPVADLPLQVTTTVPSATVGPPTTTGDDGHTRGRGSDD